MAMIKCVNMTLVLTVMLVTNGYAKEARNPSTALNNAVCHFAVDGLTHVDNEMDFKSMMTRLQFNNTAEHDYEKTQDDVKVSVHFEQPNFYIITKQDLNPKHAPSEWQSSRFEPELQGYVDQYCAHAKTTWQGQCHVNKRSMKIYMTQLKQDADDSANKTHNVQCTVSIATTAHANYFKISIF
jgi:hypothetical protein